MKNTFVLIKRILLLAKLFWPHIAGLFFLSLLATPIALLKPFALKLVIDSGFGSAPVPGFIKMFFPGNFQFTFNTIAIIAASLIIIIAIIDNIQVFIIWVIGTWVGEKLVLNFRTLVFNHIQRLSLAYHDRKGTTDSLYRIQWDTMSIRSLLLDQIPSLLSSLITLVSMIIVMFMINKNFALIALCLLPPLFILTKLSTKILKKDWYKVKDAESSAMSVINEVLSSLRVVKAFGQEESEGQRFTKRANKAMKGQVKMAKVGATFSFLVCMLLAIGTASFLYLGATYVQSGKMTLGELTLIIAYLSQIFTPLEEIIKNLNEVQSSVVGIDRVFAVLDHEKEVKELQHAIHLSRTNGAFEFKNVSFSYDKQKQILKNISVVIKPGDRVGIMGSTGAGKSTLINLLNRFYDPTGGSITIDSVDIKKYKLTDFRNQFGIVLQEPVLFSSTIAENIRYGNPGTSDKEVMEAAKAANAHDFIMREKDGYDTLVGERGMQLSGGERQRIALARAFIKNAPVLILDEPTSSLDIKTEAEVMEAIERLMAGKTTFMITHRLDSLKSCNLILHLENGELHEVIRDQENDFLEKKKAAFLAKI